MVKVDYINGSSQRTSSNEYDNLGRITSVTRGAATKSGGTVSYKYNLHGQTTEINGPGFTQNLFYADGPGKKLYNGSVSAMTWTMGTDTRVRGYKYTYNGYGWLTAAEYGENQDLGANLNRYTERFLDFMLNGGVRRLQRHGLKADRVHGKVDNLHISYDGNRIKTVIEDADPVTQNGSMDYPGGKKELEFTYNDWGALVSDPSRGITDISYDNFGNPKQIRFSNTRKIIKIYSATGEKLRTAVPFGLLLFILIICGCSPKLNIPPISVLNPSEVSIIEYQFALDKTGKVTLTQIDDYYQIQSIGPSGEVSTSQIKDEKIIDWAFSSLEKEFQNIHLAESTNSSPFISSIKLLTKENKEILRIDSNDKIINDKELENKLKELRGFLIKIWDSSMKIE